MMREATAIVEEELAASGAFQYLAILHEDNVRGVRNGNRDYGNQIVVRRAGKVRTPRRPYPADSISTSCRKKPHT